MDDPVVVVVTGGGGRGRVWRWKIILVVVICAGTMWGFSSPSEPPPSPVQASVVVESVTPRPLTSTGNVSDDEEFVDEITRKFDEWVRENIVSYRL